MSSSSAVERTMKAFLERKKRLDDVEREGREATSDESYDKEFTKLREMSASYKTGNVYPSSEGEKPCNTVKNRYKDIIPFDHTRVKLKNIKDESGTDYINASFIKGAVGGQVYIAAQGPMPKTVDDFWQMIWENNVQVIFMACREFEGDPPKLKCQRYWPNSTTEEMSFGKIKVTLTKEETTDYKEHLIRHMIAKSGDESRTVTQLHYQEWPDRGVPRCIPGILDLIEHFRKMLKLNTNETPPVLVHCSAGCGRTGTILVIDYVLSLLNYGKLTSDFSIFSIIAEMRRQRMAIVQSPEQYDFVHEAVAELFTRQLELIDRHIYDNVEPSGFMHSKPQVNNLSTDYEIVENATKKRPSKPIFPARVQSFGDVYDKGHAKSNLNTSPDGSSSAGNSYSLVQPLPLPSEPQYAEPVTKKNLPVATSPLKPKPEIAPHATYGVVRKVSADDDTGSNENVKNSEYAYADPYRPDKWSLQAIALGQKKVTSDYESIDGLTYQDDSKNTAIYAEINSSDFHSKINGGGQGAAVVPTTKCRQDETSGQPPSKEDRIPIVTNLLSKLNIGRQEPAANNYCHGSEIAQVIFRDVNISFPNRVGKPRGKRPVKMAQASSVP